MRQLYYVNGKRVDINTYARALNAQYAAEVARDEFEAKKKGFIEYIQNNPSVIDKYRNTTFSPKSVIQFEFHEWCQSEDCKNVMRNFERKRKGKAYGCLIILVLCVLLFILRVSGVL